jgi:hypothetical protein
VLRRLFMTSFRMRRGVGQTCLPSSRKSRGVR